MQSTSEFRLDFVGGWTQSRYDAAQASLEEFTRRYPLVLPRETPLERNKETTELHKALVELGLQVDIPKLKAMGVRRRAMLALVEQEDIERFGLAGTLAQYRAVYEPALDECECPSSECEQHEICTEELLERLAGVKQLQDLIEEERKERKKRKKLERLEYRQRKKAKVRRKKL